MLTLPVNEVEKNQAANFKEFADDKIGKEFNNDDIYADSEGIGYRNGRSRQSRLTRSGGYTSGTQDGMNIVNSSHGTLTDNDSIVPNELKTSDKAVARKIAKWYSIYGGGSNPALCDWHTWCIL